MTALAYDPNAFLFAIALAFAIFALFIVVIVYSTETLFKERAAPYVSNFIPRFGAVIIDITIMRHIVELLLIIANPSYTSFLYFFYAYLYLNPIFFPFMVVGTCLSTYLFFYIPIFGGTIFTLTSILIAIVGFLYFFIFEAFLGGRTIGRFIFRLKTVHESRTRTLRFEEACINTIGKTFLFLDLVFGFIMAIISGHDPSIRQVRFSQRVSGAVTMKTSFDPQSAMNISDPFSDYYSKDGELT